MSVDLKMVQILTEIFKTFLKQLIFIKVLDNHLYTHSVANFFRGDITDSMFLYPKVHIWGGPGESPPPRKFGNFDL